MEVEKPRRGPGDVADVVEATFNAWHKEADARLPPTKHEKEGLAQLAREVRLAYLVAAEARIALAATEASVVMLRPALELAHLIAAEAQGRAEAAAQRLQEAQQGPPVEVG